MRGKGGLPAEVSLDFFRRGEAELTRGGNPVLGVVAMLDRRARDARDALDAREAGAEVEVALLDLGFSSGVHYVPENRRDVAAHKLFFVFFRTIFVPTPPKISVNT